MQTYLVAPSDKLFMVGFGELRVQRHHLQRKSKTRGVTALGGFNSPASVLHKVKMACERKVVRIII